MTDHATPTTFPRTTGRGALPEAGIPEAEAPRAEAPRAGPRRAKTQYRRIVVVCSKCAKRQGLTPRAVRDRVKGAAKRASKAQSRAAGPSRARTKLLVAASGCLGPCPKRALAIATGESLAAGRVLLVDPAADRQAMLTALLPEFGPNADLAAGPSPDPALPPEPPHADAPA